MSAFPCSGADVSPASLRDPRPPVLRRRRFPGLFLRFWGESLMPVGRKIKSAVGTDIRKIVIAGRIDVRAEIHQRPLPLFQRDAPYILTAISARHIAYEIKIFAVGRHSRMAVSGYRIGCYLKFHRRTPRGVGTRRCENLHRCVGIFLTARFRQVHGLPIRRERHDPLVELCVEIALNRLRTLPLPVLIFLGEKYVGIFHASYLAFFVAHGFFSSR